MTIKSVLFVDDAALNAPPLEPRRPGTFRGAKVYARAYVVTTTGKKLPVLFTPADVAKARERAKNNPEDVAPLASWWRRAIAAALL